MLRRGALRLSALKQQDSLHKTKLHSYHVARKATMMPFCGWEMPIQFTDIFKEHLFTRQSAGMFDVSHMGQVRFIGADREKFVEWVTVADVQALPYNRSRLAVILNEQGGVIDDLMVSRHEDYVYCVINAGRRQEDIAHFRSKLEEFKGDVHMEVDEESALLALQGPMVESVLSPYVENIDTLPFMKVLQGSIAGMKARITRCGYTGEDGFEIAVSNNDAESLASLLIENPHVMNIGLGARDSLRLEAGMCLYGNELTEDTSIVEAQLNWLVTKRRWAEGNFIGHEATKLIRENAVERAPTRRVGIVSKGLCARAGANILDKEGNVIGKVTSGCPSPSLGGNIAQGYVPADVKDNSVLLQVRNRKVPGEIVKLPFITTKYKKEIKAPTKPL